MVIYSTKSSEKVFHLPHCKILHRIRKEYKKQFASQEEARAAGYRMCSCCSPVGARLRKERKAVYQFCQEYGASCWLRDNQLYVQTPRSRWRIIASGQENKLFLYHKNTYQKYEETPSIIPGYHSQRARSKTIVGYLDYIYQHDIFRRQEAIKAKKQTQHKPKPRRNRWDRLLKELKRSYSSTL